MIKNFFIVRKKSTTNPIKTTSKRAIQKQQKQLAIELVIKLLIKSQVFLKNLKSHKIMKIMMNQKHQKEDTYLQKKDNKLFMN